MIIQDKEFGDFEIKEEVLIELLNSQAIQRLKNIDQAGYAKGFFPHSRNRFDHSVGVFLLIRKYGGSLEEQMAGLIHDVSELIQIVISSEWILLEHVEYGGVYGSGTYDKIGS